MDLLNRIGSDPRPDQIYVRPDSPESLKLFLRRESDASLKGLLATLKVMNLMQQNNLKPVLQEQTGIYESLSSINASTMNLGGVSAFSLLILPAMAAVGATLTACTAPVALSVAAVVTTSSVLAGLSDASTTHARDFLIEKKQARLHHEVACHFYQLERDRGLAAKNALLTEHLPRHYESCSAVDKQLLDDLQCAITLDIPRLPAFSPHDVERKFPYDYQELRERVLLVERRIAHCVSRGDNDGAARFLENIDPRRGRPFASNQIVLDAQYIEARVAQLESLLERVQAALGDHRDAVQTDALIAVQRYCQDQLMSQRDTLWELAMACGALRISEPMVNEYWDQAVQLDAEAVLAQMNREQK